MSGYKPGSFLGHDVLGLLDDALELVAVSQVRHVAEHKPADNYWYAGGARDLLAAQLGNRDPREQSAVKPAIPLVVWGGAGQGMLSARCRRSKHKGDLGKNGVCIPARLLLLYRYLQCIPRLRDVDRHLDLTLHHDLRVHRRLDLQAAGYRADGGQAG